jgi:hypothetical protein
MRQIAKSDTHGLPLIGVSGGDLADGVGRSEGGASPG